MMKKDISANLYQKYLILCSKILLSVLNNTSVTVLLPLEHTGFQTSPILKAFLLEFLALFNIVLYIVYFRAENHYKMLKLSRLGLEKSGLLGNRIFHGRGCVPIEPSAYQVSMI